MKLVIGQKNQMIHINVIEQHKFAENLNLNQNLEPTLSSEKLNCIAASF
jgi:hypothetical protein